MAQQFGDKTIIPLAINGYDLRADYQKAYESVISQHPSGINEDNESLEIDLMDSDGFSKLVMSIDKHLQ